jgi:hypothetical protein
MSNTELIGSSPRFRALPHQVNTVASTNYSSSFQENRVQARK